MALSRKQKIKILFYFGYSGMTIIPDNTHFNSVINDHLNAASDDDDISKLVKDLLEKLEGLDAKLEKAACRVSTSKVDNITLNKDEIYWLKKERMRCIRELSDLLHICLSRQGGAMVGVLK